METETLTTKSLLAIIIALMLYQSSSFAQSAWQTGLTTFTSTTQTNRFGTATNPTGVNKLDIRFFTNGFERMRLIGEPGATQGFLGLGTPVPKNRFDVFGSAVIGTAYAGIKTAPSDDKRNQCCHRHS